MAIKAAGIKREYEAIFWDYVFGREEPEHFYCMASTFENAVAQAIEFVTSEMNDDMTGRFVLKSIKARGLGD